MLAHLQYLKFDEFNNKTPYICQNKKQTKHNTMVEKKSWKFTTKKTKISEGYLVRENVKSLSNSVTKFCDQGICEEFHFFCH